MISLKTTFLVVDDFEPMRKVTSSQLRAMGAGTIVTAANGAEALRILNKRRVDIVLSDWNMPVMGGLEAFKAMRAIDPSVPVVICTGYAENEEVQEILSLGGAGMLAKPYQLLDLSDLLKSLGTGVPSAV